ncbi:MAG: sensor histidine kinase, partial [Oligoflexales bacterium]|nr:sensor histidine kinase [Oligoflexales bacterium]
MTMIEKTYKNRMKFAEFLTVCVFFVMLSAALKAETPNILASGNSSEKQELPKMDPEITKEYLNGIYEKMPAAVIDEKTKKLSLSKYIDYLEDASGNLDILKIISVDKQERDWLSNRNDMVPVFGYTRSVYWVRYVIENRSSAQEKYFVEIAYNSHDYIEFYFITPDGKVHLSKAGNQYPYYQRPVDHHNFVFPVTFPKNQKILMAVRVQSSGSMVLPLFVWDVEYFHSIKSRELTVYGIYYGMIIVMILYNLFLYVSIRDKVYVLYSLYVISFLLYQSSYNGLAFKHLWPESSLLSKYGVYSFILSVLFWFTAFSQAFLQTRRRQPLMHFLLCVTLYPGVLIAAILLFLIGASAVKLLIAVLSLVTILFCFSIGILSLLNNYRPARFYVLAFSCMFIGTFLLVLQSLGILSPNFLTEYSGQIGSGMEIVLLSFALGDKIRFEQDQAQRNIEELNNNLEKKVEEKTEQLIVANNRLQQMDRLKTNFFQNISHELRTPLTLILSPIENANMKYPGDKDISTALKNSSRLLRLVNQLLDFQKFSISEGHLVMSEVNLTDLIITIGDYFRETAKKRNIEFILKINDKAYNEEYIHQIFINGQIDALEKIVFNYLSNALKYVKENGLITLHLQHLEGKAVISVTDNGIGISEENQKKLFRLFSQVEESASELYEGTGLGLALTKEFAAKMGGKVGVVSRPGKGSCFSVEFPAIRVENPVVNLVAVISDIRLQREIRMLTSSNVPIPKLIIFGDILELKGFSGKYDVNVLLLDDSMLGLYGNRALQEFSRENPKTSIYLLRQSKANTYSKELETAGIRFRNVEYPWKIPEVLKQIADFIGKMDFGTKNSNHKKVHIIKEWLLSDDEDRGRMSKNRNLNDDDSTDDSA